MKAKQTYHEGKPAILISDAEFTPMPLEDALKHLALSGFVSQLTQYKDQLEELELLAEDELLEEMGVGLFS